MTIDTRPATAAPPVAEVRDRVRRAGRLGVGERDELLYELVIAYRQGERHKWSALILGLLDRSIRIRVSRYQPVAPVLSIEDVYQELTLQVLRDALSIPLDGPAFLERRLVMRSADRVSRWLQRLFATAQETESLEAWAKEHESDEEEDEDA